MVDFKINPLSYGDYGAQSAAKVGGLNFKEPTGVNPFAASTESGLLTGSNSMDGQLIADNSGGSYGYHGVPGPCGAVFDTARLGIYGY